MTPSRRAVLTAGTAALLAGCGTDRRAPIARGGRRVRYGDAESQHADLRRPDTGVRARDLTVVLLHGGYWLPGYGADLMEPLVRSLTARACTTWNVEYRRTGDGGGFPATLADVAAAVDALARQDVPRTTVLLGHSAGGHLAVWAASRTAQTPGGPPQVPLARAVSLAGVLDLTAAASQASSSRPVTALMGGTPQQHPDRYALADPALLVPARCPVLAVRARDDRVVDAGQAAAYVRAARAAGGEAALVDVPGSHFTLIDPAADGADTIRRLVLEPR